MAENTKTFDEKLAEAAAKAREFTPDLAGTTFVAVTPSGAKVNIPLTMDYAQAQKYDELSENSSSVEFLEFIAELAGTETVETLKGLPIELVTAIIGQWARALHKFQGVGLGE